MDTIEEVQKLMNECYPEIPITVVSDGKDGFLVNVPDTIPIKSKDQVDIENIRYVIRTYFGNTVRLGKTRRA